MGAKRALIRRSLSTFIEPLPYQTNLVNREFRLKKKENQTIYRKHHSKVSYKAQIRILPYPGLAYLGSEQPGPGAALLGLAKSLCYLGGKFLKKLRCCVNGEY